MPTAASHHEEGNQSRKGLRRKPLPSRAIEALDARLCNAEHAGALRVRMSEISTLERFMQESLPKRHIAPQFMHRLTSGELTLDAPAHKATVAIVQATIWDFENLAGTLEPTQVSGLLNEFFSVMTEVVFDHGGTLDKFIGDGLIGFFGAPVSYEEPEIFERAVDCAGAMRRALQGFNVIWEMENLPQIKCGLESTTVTSLWKLWNPRSK